MQSMIVRGLTTNRAPFVEEAQSREQLFIEQPYELYSDENHAAWRSLFRRIQPVWEQFATDVFLEGVEKIGLDENRVPKLTDVNRRLVPLTGFRTKPVSGYVPILIFFECLRNREFPTTVTIRDASQLDYLPEPDIFHDVAGHVPMHTNRAFADTLVRFGDCAITAVELVSHIRDEAERVRRVRNMLRAMRRFFWFTVEMGLMRAEKGLRAYGSGLLSSRGEIEHSVVAPDVQRYPIQLEWVVNQGYEIDHYQPLLFVAESFDHLFHLVDELESWMRTGKLDNVAPGIPEMRDSDVKRFMDAASA